MKYNKNSVVIGILVIIIILLSAGIFYYKNKISNQNQTPTPNNLPINTTSQQQLNTSNVTNQPAYLVKAYSQNNKNYIDVDYIEVLSGAASLQAQVADGQCPNINDCYDFPNGYKRNQNPLVRTFEVVNNAPIKSSWNPYPKTNFITFTEFKNSTQAPSTKAYIRINVLNGVVTEIDRPYQE